MGAVLGIAFLVGWIAAFVWYGEWLKKGVRQRTSTTTLSADQVREIFVSSVCSGGWRVIDDGNPIVAQSSLATGTRQVLAMEVTPSGSGGVEARIWPQRLQVKVLTRVPTKGHTLRMRMNRFENALAAADPGTIQRSGLAVGAPTPALASSWDAPVGVAFAAPGGAIPTAVAPTPVSEGWYPDPRDRTRLRYWNGEAWTEHEAGRNAADGSMTRASGPVPPYETTPGAPTGVLPAASSAASWGAPTGDAWGTPAGATWDSAAPTPSAPLGRPVPAARGWWLGLVWGVLLLGGYFLPLVSLGGHSSEAMIQRAGDGIPIIVLALVGVVGAFAAAAGYEVGLGLGGGAALGGLVLGAATVPTLQQLFDLGDVSPHVGTVSLVLAAIVGLVLLVTAFSAILGPPEAADPPVLLPVASALGLAVIVGSVLVPAYDGAKVFVGDWDQDGPLAALLVSFAIAAVALAVGRSARALAFAAGSVALTAVSWTVTLSGWGSGSGYVGLAHYEWHAVGLVLVLGAGAIGALGFGNRASADGPRVRFSPVQGMPAGLVAAGIFAIGGLAVVAHVRSELDSGSVLASSFDNSYDEPSGSTDSSYSDSSYDDGYSSDTSYDSSNQYGEPTEPYGYEEDPYDDTSSGGIETSPDDPDELEWCVNQTNDPTPLNIRSGPGTDYGVLGSIPNGSCGVFDYGSQTEIENSDQGKPWVHITYDGVSGWSSQSGLYQRD